MTILMKRLSAISIRNTLPWLEISTIAVLLAILFVRLIDLQYNAAFVDEAIYITNGQQALNGTSGFVGVRYMFGSYLYPVLAASFGYLLGDQVIGARVLSALSTTGAALAVYVMTRRIFGGLAGVLAMACFGFAASTRLIGQLATYDTLGVGLTAIAAALLVLGLTEPEDAPAERQLFLSSVIFALAVLTKYIALLLTPTLALLFGLLLLRRDWRRVHRLMRSFALPMLLILGTYGMVFLDDLLLFVQSVRQLSSQPAPRQEILQAIKDALWQLSALGIAGVAAFVVLPPTMARHMMPDDSVGLMRTWSTRVGVAMLLASAALTLPTYHFAATNIRSMDKHIAYTLIFVTPLAGYALTTLFRLATWSLPARLRGSATQALFVVVCAVGSFAHDQSQTELLKHLWPNEQATLTVLGRLPMPTGTQVLAEGGTTYAMYLGWGNRVRLSDTWATSYQYKSQNGTAALETAIRDRTFAYITLNRFYTPETSARLDQVARESGYREIARNSVGISNGSQITTTVFANPSIQKEMTP